MKKGITTPTIDFSLITNGDIASGSFLFGFDLNNGNLLSKMDSSLNLTLIEKLDITISLTAAQLKTGNSIPVVAIPAPGVGKAIEVLSAVLNYTKNNGALSCHDIMVITDTTDLSQLNCNGNLNPNANFKGRLMQNTGVTGVSDIVENKSILIKTDVDSGAGTGTAKFYIRYRIITL